MQAQAGLRRKSIALLTASDRLFFLFQDIHVNSRMFALLVEFCLIRPLVRTTGVCFIHVFHEGAYMLARFGRGTRIRMKYAALDSNHAVPSSGSYHVFPPVSNFATPLLIASSVSKSLVKANFQALGLVYPRPGSPQMW